jgi:ketosteroid isomerase-like protein
MRAAVAAAFLSLTLASPSAVAATPDQERAAILQTIAQMEAAWNRGDFRGYMAGFKNPDAIFVSGGKFLDGWQGRLDRYIRDYGGSPERSGKLHFYNMKIDLLAPDAAMLIGQYRLVRGSRVTEGVNTRLFRKIDGKWLITMNHVSAYDVEPSPTAPEAR